MIVKVVDSHGEELYYSVEKRPGAGVWEFPTAHVSVQQVDPVERVDVMIKLAEPWERSDERPHLDSSGDYWKIEPKEAASIFTYPDGFKEVLYDSFALDWVSSYQPARNELGGRASSFWLDEKRFRASSDPGYGVQFGDAKPKRRGAPYFFSEIKDLLERWYLGLSK